MCVLAKSAAPVFVSTSLYDQLCVWKAISLLNVELDSRMCVCAAGYVRAALIQLETNEEETLKTQDTSCTNGTGGGLLTCFKATSNQLVKGCY